MLNSSTKNVPDNLTDLLRYRAHHQPDKVAYIFLKNGESEESGLTYQELDRKARSVAAKLQSIGAAGERAMLLYPPGLEYIAAFFGCLYAGVIAVPAYPPHPARLDRTLPRLRNIAKSAQPFVLLTTSSVSDKLGSQADRKTRLYKLLFSLYLNLAKFRFCRSTFKLLFSQYSGFEKMHWLSTDSIQDDMASDWKKPALNGDSLAFFQYTSGSTGDPKGVMVSHGNLLYNSGLICQCFENTPEDTGVIWLPPYHDMGLIGGILQPLYAEIPVVLMSPVAFLQKPLRWLQAISRYKATVSGGPNFAYDLCLRKTTPEQRADLDLSTWKIAFSGAEPIRHETLDRFSSAFEPCGFRRNTFYPCYGLAEATLIVSGGIRNAEPILKKFSGDALKQNRVFTAKDGDADAYTLAGCGKTLDNQQIIIVNPDTFRQCQSDEVGEIWISGKSVTQGYWQKTGDTDQTFQACLSDNGEGPFLRTGDLGFLWDDELFITGRLKDVIIIRGRNHYPQDIELTVENAFPRVRPGCSAAFEAEVQGESRLVVAAEVERRIREPRRETANDPGYKKKDRSNPSNRRQYTELPHYSNLELKEPLNTGNAVRAIRRAVAKQHGLQVYAVLLLKVGSIPKTSSGKIQRHACKAGFLDKTLNVLETSILKDSDFNVPDNESRSESFQKPKSESSAYAGPGNETEQILADIWQELLGIRQIGIYDDFFEIGGDSLLATQVISRVHDAFGVELTLASLFDNPRISDMAEAIVRKKIEQTDEQEMVRLLEELEQMPEEEAKKKFESS